MYLHYTAAMCDPDFSCAEPLLVFGWPISSLFSLLLSLFLYLHRKGVVTFASLTTVLSWEKQEPRAKSYLLNGWNCNFFSHFIAEFIAALWRRLRMRKPRMKLENIDRNSLSKVLLTLCLLLDHKFGISGTCPIFLHSSETRSP